MPSNRQAPENAVFAPSDAAAALYFGKVMHARLKPFAHRFSYRVMSLLIDVDRLGEADRMSHLFGVNRAAVQSFHERDHGPRDGSSLRVFAQRTAAARGIDLTAGRVLLLCYPRLFGYAFNPLSIYYCFSADGELTLLIYEVRNTFGEMHHYVLPVGQEQGRATMIRQQQDKLFYVSPFIADTMRYQFRVSPPGGRLQIHILETDADGPLLAATFSGKRRTLSSRALLAASVLLPLVTFKIIGAIHWQALRLWLKGAKLVPRHQLGATGARPDGTKTGLTAVPN
jgi:DUF1365 family protein